MTGTNTIRRARAALALLGVTLTAGAAIATAAPAAAQTTARPVRAGGGVSLKECAGCHTIRPQHASGKCLGVAGSSTQQGAKVIQYACNGNRSQVWQTYPTSDYKGFQYVNLNSGMCLDVPRDSGADGVQLVQYLCGRRTNQLFTYFPVKNIQTIQTSREKCLDVRRSSRANGAAVVQFRCTGAKNQDWGFTNA